MPTLTPITGALNPGIVRVVEWLRAHGFDTTDSGDGATHDHPCDRPYPYVSMRGTEADARRLAALLRARGVVAMRRLHRVVLRPVWGSRVPRLRTVRGAMRPRRARQAGLRVPPCGRCLGRTRRRPGLTRPTLGTPPTRPRRALP